MSNLPIFDVAGSALQAQSVRLNTIASNLSNADSIASSPDAVYKPIEPVFKAVPASADGSLTGVQVKQIEQTIIDDAFDAGWCHSGEQHGRY